MTRPDPARARAAILEVIEKQIRSHDPPQTAQTLKRLMNEGHSREDAMKYIACALSVELFGAMKSESQFDNARYVGNLEQLPKLPWDEDE